MIIEPRSPQQNLSKDVYANILLQPIFKFYYKTAASRGQSIYDKREGGSQVAC